MARELKTAAPLLDAAERGDEPPELVRGPFTGGDGIQIMIQAAPPPPENLAPTTLSQSLLHSMADAPLGGSNEGPLAGLSSEEAQRRLAQYGRNEIPEHVEPWYVMLGKQFVGMMPGMLIIAAILSGISRDWTDFAVITLMLIVNALIGFHEEFKARQSLDALKAQMTATVPVKRDGSMMIVPVAELVSGDVIFLRGGNIVPADCEFLEGDEMLVDTAALTGEPLPRKVPRPDRPDEPQGAGKMLLSGCIVKPLGEALEGDLQGEAHCEVKETGLNTEIGQEPGLANIREVVDIDKRAAGLVAEASGHQASMFESKIMQVVHAVILLSLVDAGVVLYVDVGHRGVRFSHALLNVLALVIGAVPIALPLVMQVTMAIGAASMAKRQAIVTHLTALQEIASMTVLCSDKTGTLTTADMRVLPHRTWTCNRTTKDEALLYACLASNPANKEDPIDKAILGSGHEHFGEEEADKLMAMYKKGKFVGFNPTVKRTVVYCEHEEKGKFKISKGLVNKVLITGDDGGDCWECVDADKLKEELNEVDIRFSSQGYKTVGLAVSHNEGPMQFAAIIPMLDPPRGDTKLTIHRIREAGINVKMITGDHLNIAIETSRLIGSPSARTSQFSLDPLVLSSHLLQGLGTHVLPASELWPASATRDETIVTADGFAQVLPKDKREVILVLQNRGLVVGMTGDGVNDAPALAQAQIGIAVDGATEAARSAADIILTQPGLSAIFDAVVESRKIFARLRSYVLYRIGATIQIVLVLSILIYAYNDTMPAIYVILLALVNDVTMLPVASDNASPSALPEIPSMPQILLASFLYGFIGTGQTMALYLSDVLHSDPSMDPEERRQYRMAVTYLQMSIAVELNIFSCRTPLYVANLLRPETWPSLLLFICVMGGNLLVSLLAGFGDTFHVVHKVEPWRVELGCSERVGRDDGPDPQKIWVYDIGCLLVIDFLKRFLLAEFVQSGEIGGGSFSVPPAGKLRDPRNVIGAVSGWQLRQKTVENLRALQYAPHFLSFLLVGAGCGFLLVNALYNAMANEPELEKDGKTFGQFSIIQGAVGLASGLLYLFWNLRCPHCLTMRQEQVGVSILILSNVIAFLILSAFWSVGAPDYPVFVAGAAAAQVIGNFTIYLLFPMVSTYYAGWLVAPVRAGTDVSSLITSLIGQAQNPDPGIGTLFFIYAIFSVCGLGAWASIMYLGTGLRYEIDDEGTVTLSESEDESDESRTWESDESECREFHVANGPHYGCLDGLACPRQLLLPVVLATLSQVAQWGIAASLGQIGAAMTDPVGCHGHQGKRVYRYALTSSMISVPIGSILSTAWNCPRSIFNALSCVQLLAAAVVGSDA
ncbi:unnamed protein product [Durusdinium trenchii]|uniref:P-type H(+)-exporting transporter n=1 Tax=Durusdinium trenchii TaxID=1381693 RepID=A0ABP0NRV3_9DINO